MRKTHKYQQEINLPPVDVSVRLRFAAVTKYFASSSVTHDPNAHTFQAKRERFSEASGSPQLPTLTMWTLLKLQDVRASL